MFRIRSRAVVGVITAALVLTPTLAACGGVAEEAAEQAAEQAIGGDVELTDEGVTMTDEEGNEVAVGEDVAVPDNWPAEVPLLDGGTLQMVSVDAEGGASAMWMTDATPEEAATAYNAALESAGYTSETTSNMGGMFLNEYTGNGFTVSTQAIEADGSTTFMVVATKG